MVSEILGMPWVVWPCGISVVLGDCSGTCDPLPATLHFKKGPEQRDERKNSGVRQ